MGRSGLLPIFHSAADEVSRTNRYCGKFGDEEAFVLLANGGITYVEKVQQGLLKMPKAPMAIRIDLISFLDE